MTKRPVILVADDDRDDLFFIDRAFQDENITCRVEHVRNGQELIDYLLGTDGYEDRNKFPLPELLLCDIKMPYHDGFEALAWLRGRHEFEKLPVVIMTSSNLINDMQSAFKLGADAFVAKDNLIQDPAELVEVVRRFVPC